jgi:hypothetical protein
VLRESGDIAAGSRQTCDETGTDRISHLCEYDGNIASCLLQRDQGHRRTGDEHVRLQPNQLRSMSLQAFEVATGPTRLDLKILAQHPTVPHIWPSSE